MDTDFRKYYFDSPGPDWEPYEEPEEKKYYADAPGPDWEPYEETPPAEILRPKNLDPVDWRTYMLSRPDTSALINSQRNPEKELERIDAAIRISSLTGDAPDAVYQNLDDYIEAWTGEKGAFKTGLAKIKKAYQLGQKEIERMRIGLQLLQGNNSPELRARLAEMKQDTSVNDQVLDAAPTGWPTKMMSAFAQTLPFMADVATRGAQAGLATGTAVMGMGAASGAFAATAGAATAATGGLAAIPLAGLFGMAYTVGSAVGSAQESMGLMSGGAYLDLLDAGVSDEIAKPIAYGIGTLSGVVEMAQVSSALKSIGIGKFAERAVKDGIVNTFAKRAIVTYLKETAVNYGEQVGEEVIQKAIEIAGQEIAKELNNRTNGTDIERRVVADAVSEMVDEAKNAALAFAPMIAGGALIRLPGAVIDSRQTGAVRSSSAPYAGSALTAEELAANGENYTHKTDINSGERSWSGNLSQSDIDQMNVETVRDVLTNVTIPSDEKAAWVFEAYSRNPQAVIRAINEIEADEAETVSPEIKDAVGEEATQPWQYTSGQYKQAVADGVVERAPVSTEGLAGRERIVAQLQNLGSRVGVTSDEDIDTVATVITRNAQFMGVSPEQYLDADIQLEVSDLTDEEIKAQPGMKRQFSGVAFTGMVNGEARRIIGFGPTATRATFIHEPLHDMINWGQRNRDKYASVNQRMIEMEEAFGVTDGNWEAEADGEWETWFSDAMKELGHKLTKSEVAAYALEDYIREKTAPNAKVAGVLQKLVEWLRGVWNDIRNRVKMTDEMRSWFDQYLGEDISATEQPGTQEVSGGYSTSYQVDVARDAEGRLLAPNGNPSNLTESQWKQVRTPEFKRWFGDWENDPANASKVVDENGEPMVVYHGTRNSFTEFDEKRIGSNTHVTGEAFFFTDDVKLATEYATYSGGIMPVFLSLQNPEIIDAEGRYAPAVLGTHETSTARERGKDGMIAKRVTDSAGYIMTGPGGYSSAREATLFLAFQPTQIKSATANVGTFDPNDERINYQVDANYQPQKTGTGYKIFEHVDGKLYPLFLGADKETPVGKWLKAEVNSRKGFAQRPGWHLGAETPDAPWLKSIDGTYKSQRKAGAFRVWAEVEYPADVNYQDEADKSPTKDLPGMLPENGFYKFKEGSRGTWIITGAIKVNRILSEKERKAILLKQGYDEEAAFEPYRKMMQKRQETIRAKKISGSNINYQVNPADYLNPQLFPGARPEHPLAPIGSIAYHVADVEKALLEGASDVVPKTEGADVEGAFEGVKSFINTELRLLSDIIDPKLAWHQPTEGMSLIEYARRFFSPEGIAALRAALSKDEPPEWYEGFGLRQLIADKKVREWAKKQTGPVLFEEFKTKFCKLNGDQGALLKRRFKLIENKYKNAKTKKISPIPANELMEAVDTVAEGDLYVWNSIKSELSLAEEIAIGVPIKPGWGERFLATNRKTGGYSWDFALLTCMPTARCEVCYAKSASTTRFDLSAARLRHTLVTALYPLEVGRGVAEFIKSKKKTEVAMLRVNGAGDTTFEWQIKAVNEAIKNLDRPVHIFSRSHDARIPGSGGLDQISNGWYDPDDPSNGVAVFKMGSSDKQLVKEYGIDYLKDNLRKRGIVNSYLTGAVEDAAIVKKLREAGVFVILHTHTSNAVITSLDDEGLLATTKNKNSALAAVACSCATESGPFLGGCNTCFAVGDPCFAWAPLIAMTPDGELYLLSDLLTMPTDKLPKKKLVPMSQVGVTDELKKELEIASLSRAYSEAAKAIRDKATNSIRNGGNIVVENPRSREKIATFPGTDQGREAARKIAEDWAAFAAALKDAPGLDEILKKDRATIDGIAAMDRAVAKARGLKTSVEYHIADPEHAAQVKAAIELGQPVPLEVLEEYRGESWADEEVSRRRDMIRDIKAEESVDDWVAYQKSMELPGDERSEAYYRQVYAESSYMPPPSRPTAETARETGNRVFLESLDKGLLESILGTIGVLGKNVRGMHGLVQSGITKVTRGVGKISDAHYKSLMVQIKANVEQYRELFAGLTEDQEALEAFYAEAAEAHIDTPELAQESDPVLKDPEKKKNTRVADLLATLSDFTKSARAEARMATREAKAAGKEALAGYKADQRERARFARAVEAEQQAQVKRDAREQKEYDAFKTYTRKLWRYIMKPVSLASVDLEYAEKIQQRQSLFAMKGPNSREYVLRQQLKGWLEKNPDIEATPQMLHEVSRVWIGDLSVADLEEVANEIRILEDAGRREFLRKKFQEAVFIEGERGRVADSLSKTKGGKVEAYGSEEAAKVLKGKLKYRMGSSTLRMVRLAEMMDGGQEDGPVKEWLFRKVNEATDASLRATDERLDNVLTKLKGLGITDKRLRERYTVNDQTYTVDQIITMYMYQQNEEAFAHLVHGNRIEPGDLAQFIDKLTRKEKGFAEWLMWDVFGMDNYERVQKVFGQLENKRMPRVEKYFPVRVQDPAAYKDLNAEITKDMNAQAGFGRPGVRKGFTFSRIKIAPEHQSPIRLGVMEITKEQVERQEYYIAHAELVKRLNRIFGEKEMRQEITGKFGADMLKALDEYLNEVASPMQYKARDAVSRTFMRVMTNAQTAALAFNLLTILKNVTGFLNYLPHTNTPQLMRALGETLVGYKKMKDFVESRDPQVKHRAIDPYKHYLNAMKNQGFEGANKKIAETGMIGLEFMDHFTVIVGWKSVYETEMAKHGDEAKAIRAAQEATLKTQPTGTGKDLPSLYRNETVRPFLLFSNQLNQNMNMLVYDLPAAAKRGQILRAMRYVTAFAVVGLMMGMASRRRLPEDWKEAAWDMASQFINPFPFIGNTIVDALGGSWYAGRGVDFFGSAIVTSVRGLKTIADDEKDAKDKVMAAEAIAVEAMRLLGLPSVQTHKIVKAIVNQDLMEILGARR